MMRPARSPLKYRKPDHYLQPIGWLFADLLLMLAMLFLIASTGYFPKPQLATPAKKSVTPSAAITTPTSPVQESLDFNPVEFNINVDYVTLLSDHPQSAIADIQKQVKQQKRLWRRHAALVLAFGGASSTDQITTADEVSAAVYHALQGLGTTPEITVAPGVTISFWNTRYYKSSLHDVEPDLDLSIVELVIYCFSQTNS